MYYNICSIIAGASTKFELVNFSGDVYKSEELGLLLYNGGTVCDDSFDTIEANAICIQMGFKGANGLEEFSSSIPGDWSFRLNYEIKLDEIDCVDGIGWEGCTYETDHDCSHDEDVFISCRGENII